MSLFFRGHGKLILPRFLIISMIPLTVDFNLNFTEVTVSHSYKYKTQLFSPLNVKSMLVFNKLL